MVADFDRAVLPPLGPLTGEQIVVAGRQAQAEIPRGHRLDKIGRSLEILGWIFVDIKIALLQRFVLKADLAADAARFSPDRRGLGGDADEVEADVGEGALRHPHRGAAVVAEMFARQRGAVEIAGGQVIVARG